MTGERLYNKYAYGMSQVCAVFLPDWDDLRVGERAVWNQLATDVEKGN